MKAKKEIFTGFYTEDHKKKEFPDDDLIHLLNR